MSPEIYLNWDTSNINSHAYLNLCHLIKKLMFISVKLWSVDLCLRLTCVSFIKCPLVFVFKSILPAVDTGSQSFVTVII